MSAGRRVRGGRYTPPRRHQRWVATSKGDVLFVMADIDDEADPAHKNARALRNAATVAGRCPSCGGTFDVVGVDRSGVTHVLMVHENDCPVLLDSRAG